MAMTLRQSPEDEEASRRLHRDKIATLSASARDRYADLLDRLGQ